jgi:VanZ family protein
LSSTAVPSGNIQITTRKLLSWLPTLLWLCLLASFSTDTFSAEHTGSVLWKILHFVYPGISLRQFEVLHFFVRKTAHFTAYGMLSVFAYFSWKATLPSPKNWTLRWCLLALAVTLVAGSLDEFHQSFVPSRTSSVRDVMIDVTGGLFFQLVIAVMFWQVSRRRRRAP